MKFIQVKLYHLFLIFFLSMGLCFINGCSKKVSKSPTPQGDYLNARKYFKKKNYLKSSAYAWLFIQNNQNTAENYVGAEFIFAKSLEKLKLYTVALEYYVEVIRHGANKEFIGESLKSIFNLIEKLPYDAHLIEQELLASSEFAEFSEALDEQIKFFQGKDDYIKDDTQWGDDKFNYLKEGGLPYQKVEYTKIIRGLSESEEEKIAQESIDQLVVLLEKVPEQTRLKNLIRKTLARLLFEQQEYENSLKFYNEIDSNILTQSDVFLEKAWNHFWLYDYQKSLGSLHALRAPHFDDISQPEKYLLYGMVLRNLCRYSDARKIIDLYRKQYSKTIEKIKDGDSLSKINALSDAAKYHPLIQNIWNHQKLIGFEKERLVAIKDKQWQEYGLMTHLSMIYSLKEKELKAEVLTVQEEALKDVSSEIIHFNEQMNILEYETRMDEFKRGQFSDTKKPVEHKKLNVINADPLHWKFDREFWIDELDLYLVKMESLCE
ncbi:MAG TPA: hypothetical protein PKC21_01460 [Oligoflexia bacterium]|nr:hypothetical protein [Oligoflexia bacterium]HMR23998.1 hypothetical protein [Oligoflexia bacterium]